jgi:ferredoxin, 2Fe-2S
MPKITYVEHNGTRHVVEVASGLSVMRGAIDNGVPGIDADCGGNCACATCHIFIGPEWAAKAGGQGEMEADMLSFAAATQPESRLACQITVTAALDGLVVSMPESQH